VRRSLALLALVLLVAGVGIKASGADFTAASASPGNSFATAADFNTVAVTLTDPGATLHGSVALAATATSERGIATVRYQTSPAGAGTWTDACVASSAPFSCSFDTTGVADGLRDVRAIATDTAGYAKTSATIASRRVDNTLPAVSLTDPGTLTGTEALNATASDGGSGLASLSIDYRPAAGGSWTTVCSGATSPRACSLNTGLMLDGSYELRAHAVDAAGNAADSSLTRVADNTAPTGSIPQPGPLRGTVDVSITAADGAGSGVASVTGQFRQAGGSTWSDVCTDTVAPYACTAIDTTPYPDGLYEARAIVVDGIGLSTTTAITTVRIDNTAPSTATLTNPGTSLSGSVALSGTAADAGSGIAAWTVQYRTAGGSTWTDACTDTTSSYGCTWATTGVTDGLYDVRALARDNAGNTTGSTVYSSVRVDNVVPTVTLADPGTPITNTVTLTANAADGGGVASVVFARSKAGLNSWTTICTDTVAPYTCDFDTTAVTEQAYDLRALVTDNAGRTATSVVASRTVNHAPYGTDVQATNVGGGTAGKLDAGDTLRLTYSEAMAPASLSTGFTGASQAIRVYVNDGGTVDTMDFRNSAGTARLNLTGGTSDLNLGAEFVSTATIFNATMTMSGTVVTITLGTKVSGTLKTTAAVAAKMTWTPSSLATDVAGIAALTTLVNESGTTDRDF
jgi:chitinase